MKYILFLKLFFELLWSKWEEATIGIDVAYKVSSSIHLKKRKL